MKRKDSESIKKSSRTPIPKEWQRVLGLMIVAGWVIPTVLFSILVLFAPQTFWIGGPPWLYFATRSTSSCRGSSMESTFSAMRVRPCSLRWQLRQPPMLFLGGAMTGTSMVLTAIGFRGASETLAVDHSWKKLLGVTLISPWMAPLCLFAVFCLPGDPSFARGLTATSRIGYAWMGSLAVLFSSFLTCAWPVSVRALIFYSSLRRNHHA